MNRRRIFQRFAEPVHGFAFKNLEGLFLKNNVVSIDTKFAGVQVEFKFRPRLKSTKVLAGRFVAGTGNRSSFSGPDRVKRPREGCGTRIV